MAPWSKEKNRSITAKGTAAEICSGALDLMDLFLHKWNAGIPRLPNLFANRIISILKWVKQKSVSFGRVNLTAVIEDRLVSKNTGRFLDVADKTCWAYYDIMEAVNPHNYTRGEDGEEWTGLK
ncbi:hypothetical protein [Feifania hominis]|uniref:Uncharacterized protein n=1 Tax=Feifania hominis TaxID=2763660 RepID=A0A926HPT9_9FIRM|nr:hypothetical protein [Feifania hominis]MBC8535622.1 hypothetical protein [Feifania hominis]